MSNCPIVKMSNIVILEVVGPYGPFTPSPRLVPKRFIVVKESIGYSYNRGLVIVLTLPMMSFFILRVVNLFRFNKEGPCLESVQI